MGARGALSGGGQGLFFVRREPPEIPFREEPFQGGPRGLPGRTINLRARTLCRVTGLPGTALIRREGEAPGAPGQSAGRKSRGGWQWQGGREEGGVAGAP